MESSSRTPHDNESVDEALLRIAKLGHAQLIPFLASVIHWSYQGDRGYATIALSFTASREAVPILIDLLPGPDTELHDVAEYGLETLTHHGPPRRLEERVASDYPPLQHRWRHWWGVHGATASIYEDQQCGETLPLN